MISLNTESCISFTEHRSGWKYCLDSLRPLQSKGGIYVDGFIEKSFCWSLWDYHWARSFNDIPYEREWIGFFHNPPNIPKWWDYMNSPEAVIERDVFKASLPSCKAIVVLSEYLKNYLQEKVDVPVISVKYATDPAVPAWRPEYFLQNPEPQLIQIGYWLRKLNAIFEIKAPLPFRKAWLPSNVDYAKECRWRESTTKKNYYIKNYKDSTVWLREERLSNEEYDSYMTNNVVFLDMYDSSANTTVIECIARNTPLLVNRLPAVIEYCGEDYPLYFDSLEEAADILTDTERIIAAHEHFKNMDKRWLRSSYFASDLVEKLGEVWS